MTDSDSANLSVRADTRWLSYDDLAELTGAKRESVVRIVRRKKWPRREGNKPGDVRVAVPADVIADMQRRIAARHGDFPDSPADSPRDNPEDKTRTISLLESALDTLRDQLTAAEARAARAENAAEQTRATAAEERERLQGQVAELISQVTDLLAAAKPTAPESRRGLLSRLLRSLG